MADEESPRIGERRWTAMDARDWDEVASLLADDVGCDWPIFGEWIRGRDDCVATNRANPGHWSIAVRRVTAEGNRVASEVGVTPDGRSDAAVSLDDLRDGEIVRAGGDGPEPYAAPAWRAWRVDPLGATSGSPPVWAGYSR